MRRAIVVVLDSLGVGAAADADAYGDGGADTLGHIVEACAAGRADSNGRAGHLNIPHLTALGLIDAAEAARGAALPAARPALRTGRFGYAAERSRGKDTPSGHWEMMGLPVEFDWGYFPDTKPCLPQALTDALIRRGGIGGILGNRHASGTQIVAELGDEHLRTLFPIVYTSGDSVLQIAAHEERFGLERLYALCRVARELVDAYRIARVIARPFVGDATRGFIRTGNRRDLATPPHGPTLLDVLQAAGGEVICVGKVADIFAHRGVTRTIKAHGNQAVMDELLLAMRAAPDRSLLFANCVDFDTNFGHRRDVSGYARALEEFDGYVPSLRATMRPGDVGIITADHGCDPTFPGSDHTREYVPVLGFGESVSPGPIGRRSGFADIGQSLAGRLGLAPLGAGIPFL
ncbi:MAG TPA: phosphopentomutase [Steroidobacteraceae bacterium]|nr:phosphopentomutase [Steroidobacteraceae bacterium]